MGRSFPLRCFAESASHSGRSKWDTLSQRRSNGKLRPIIRSRNGMHFPNESKTGKCIPQSALKVGRRFPMRLKRKMHPGICAQSGMRFPVEGLRGKCVPESTLEMGCSFPSGNCIPFQTRIPGHTFRKQRRPHNVAFNLYMFGDTPKTSHAPTSGRLSRRRHIRFITSSARKGGHLMWPPSCAGLSEQGTLYASAWTDVSVVAQQLAAT